MVLMARRGGPAGDLAGGALPWLVLNLVLVGHLGPT